MNEVCGAVEDGTGRVCDKPLGRCFITHETDGWSWGSSATPTKRAKGSKRDKMQGILDGIETQRPVGPPEVDEPGVKLHRDPHPTEVAAANKILGRSGAARRQVYEFLVARGEDGATDEEIQAMLRMNPNTERPRRGELEDWGYVANSGRTRRNVDGNAMIVWVTTEFTPPDASVTASSGATSS